MYNSTHYSRFYTYTQHIHIHIFSSYVQNCCYSPGMLTIFNNDSWISSQDKLLFWPTPTMLNLKWISLRIFLITLHCYWAFESTRIMWATINSMSATPHFVSFTRYCCKNNYSPYTILRLETYLRKHYKLLTSHQSFSIKSALLWYIRPTYIRRHFI